MSRQGAARLGLKAAASAVLAGLAIGPAAFAALPGARDPNWPCEQIKVPELSVAAFWAGPPIDPYEKTWAQDPVIAKLAAHLAQRRIPLEQAQAEIDSFAKEAGDDRKTKLLALLAGLFDTLDQERASIIDGLDRFGSRQKELADDIRSDLDELHALQAESNPDTQRIAALGEKLQWETRVFEERRQTTQYVCHVPDMIEQRLFALARTIQHDLG